MQLGELSHIFLTPTCLTMSYLPQNLKYLRKINFAKAIDVAAGLNIAQGTYSKYESNAMMPNAVLAQKMASYFGVSVEDLLNKDLSQQGFAAINTELSEEKRLMPYSKPLRPDKGIPLYDLPVSAGLAGFAMEGSVYSEQPIGYFPRTPFTKDGDGAFPISGLSMEPTVNNGDYIVVKRLKSLDLLDTGCVYLIIAQGERMIKRYLPPR